MAFAVPASEAQPGPAQPRGLDNSNTARPCGLYNCADFRPEYQGGLKSAIPAGRICGLT